MITKIFQNRYFYKVKYPNLRDLKSTLIPLINNTLIPEYNFFNEMKGICCVVKNYKYLLETKLPENIPWLDYLLDINQFVTTHANEYVKLTESTNLVSSIEGIWFSHYPTNAYFDYHEHIGVSAVAVLYLEKPVNSGNLHIKETTNSKSIEIFGEEGDLIIFPGFLPHKTTPNLNSMNRTVITYDLMYSNV